MDENVQDLPLRSNNPYSIGQLFIFPEGDVLLIRDPLVATKSARDRYHTTIDGDTLNALAFKYYGDAKEWWVIADTNNIFNPFELATGTTLLIPDLTRIKTYS